MALGKWFGRKKDQPAAGEQSAPATDSRSAQPGAEAAAVADPSSPDRSVRDASPPHPPASVSTESPAKTEPAGAFARLKRGLAKTRKKLAAILPFGRKLDAEALEEIEATLIQADFGPALAMDLTEELREAYGERDFDAEQIVPFLKQRLLARLGENSGISWAESGPTVVLVAGVNGTGKTTSIAKLANRWQQEGRKVLLAAGDTFRAAAVEQLEIWSQRIGCPIVRGPDESDPASVVFDAIEQAKSGGFDVVIVDTAGRLHTDKNLMNQLGKIVRVVKKQIPEAPHEVLQVLDATTGQNAIQQAREFHRILDVTALVLTKLDGTARGGVIFPILAQVGLPVKYIGVGEGIDDLQVFHPPSFVDALLD